MGYTKAFSRAVKEEHYRQTFLDLVSQNHPEYVGKVHYDSHQPGDAHWQPHMQTIPYVFDLIDSTGQYRVTPMVKVYPASFDLTKLHRNEDDFLSTLEDHEYYHALELATSPSMIEVIDAAGTSFHDQE